MIGVAVRGSGLVLDEDLSPATPGDGEALVEMEAACIAPLDLQIAAGAFPMRPPAPYVAGLDGAGRVVSGDLRGRRVWVRGAGVGTTRNGCAGEQAVLPVASLHELREDVDAATAATFFVPCSTAHAALHDVGRLRPGERVGVRGASGSVGGVAVQLALAAGAAEVVGVVASPERAASVPPGARVVAAGSPVELRSELHGADLDLLVDTVGGAGLAACLGAMRARARIVLVGYAGGVRLELDATELLVHDVSLLPLNGLTREPDTLPRAGEWLDAIVRGELAVPTSAFPVARADEALAAVGGSPSPGRVAVLFG